MASKTGKTSPPKSSKAENMARMTLTAFILGPFVWLLGGSGFEWLKSLLIAIGLALLIRWTMAEPFRIPSGSMEPTFLGDPRILRGDRVFVNKVIYGLRYPLNRCRIPLTDIRIDYADKRIWRRSDPKRWDIVVFKSVERNATHTTLVKRVVGLPGERIHIADGGVYVNGTRLELPPGMPDVVYTSPRPGGSYDPAMKYGILTDDEYSLIPQDCYLLLGDNSSHSRDGRWFGWVSNEHILGRVASIWFPPTRWRDFSGFSKTWWWRALVTALSVLSVWRVFFGRSWRAVIQTPGGNVKVSHLLINRWAFGIPVPFTRRRLSKGRTPRRGELVLYHSPAKIDGHEHILLGRVAGLPGERVFLDGGSLHVDGEPVSGPSSLADREFAAAEGVGPYGRSKGKAHSRVPEDAYFILTESAGAKDHYDSRTVGWVPRQKLIGPASLVWWPPQRWGRAM